MWAEIYHSCSLKNYRMFQLLGSRVAAMRILVACEYSGRVRTAFRDLGHEAWSCDIIPSEDDSSFHIKMDVLELLELTKHTFDWDMMVAFPPCTHLASSGARWFEEKRIDGRQVQGIGFFMSLVEASIPLIAIENPIGIMSTIYRKPDQIIQPWQFGHGETKATCIWLKGLELLKPTNIVEGRESRIHKMPPSDDRSKKRSLTYQGIADAMATQWAGGLF